ncbi:MAG: hypothetical protein NWF00_07965 [Candidatus Bathyarchaeota archaeon]|nr:hypothetical protein [Candidatus Bathyarchaeota archaeon]
MAEAKRQLLTVGAFLIVLVVAIVLYAAGVIEWTLIFPLVLAFFGVWLLALAAMRSGSTQKYERGAFSTLSMGLLFIAVGGSWYLFSFNWLYSVAVILIALAALAIVAAFRHK